MSQSQRQRLDYNQQIIAVDTKFNKYRGATCHSAGPGAEGSSNVSQVRKMYQKRRMQLLSASKTASQPAVAECECCEVKTDDGGTQGDDVRKNINYLHIRTQLLRQHVRAQGMSDLHSTKSWSVSTGETRGGLLSAAPAPSSQYDFQGFHHLSDLHRGAVTHLMFAHNSANTLLASSEDGSLSVHSLDTEPPSVTATLAGHSAAVTDFDISTSNELLVSCGRDSAVCVWALPGGALVRQMRSSCGQPLTSCRFVPGNNNLVVAGGVAGLLQTLNISTGMFPSSGTSTLPGAVLCLAMGGQDNLVWAGTERGTIVSFKVDLSGQLTKGHRTVASEAGHAVTSVASKLSPGVGGTLLLVSVRNNCLQLYKVTDTLGSLQLYKQFPVMHSACSVRSTFAPLMRSRSGDIVVSGSEDGCIFFFDASRSSKSCINKLEAHSCPALAVAFNYNESYLATSDQSGLVIVWKR